VRFGEGGTRLDRACEGVARVFELSQFGEHQSDTVPRHGVLGIHREHFPVRFQRELHPLPLIEQQRLVQPGLAERCMRVQRATKRLEGRLGLAGVVQRHTQIVERQRVRRLQLDGARIAGLRIGKPAALVQCDPALVPELGALGQTRDERVVQRQRRRRVARDEMNLRDSLFHEVAVFTTMQRELILAEGLVVIALFSEREAKVVVRERRFLADLDLHDAPGFALGLLDVLLARRLRERQVGPRSRQRGVELDRALRRLACVVVQARVAQHEAQEIPGFVILGVELDRPAQTGERVRQRAAVIRDLAKIEMDERAVGVGLERLLEIALRHIDVSDFLLRERQLHERAKIARVVLQQLLEFRDRVHVLAQ